MSGILAPALVETALITLRSTIGKKSGENPVPHLPVPSVYVDVLVIYGALGLVSGRGERVAAMVGWGFVVATALNMTGVLAKLGAKATPAQSNKTTTTSGGSSNG